MNIVKKELLQYYCDIYHRFGDNTQQKHETFKF